MRLLIFLPQCLPPRLQILNIYGSKVQRTSLSRVDVPSCASLLHFGAGYNELGDDWLSSLPGLFPSLLSLDLSFNHVSDLDAALLVLADMPALKHLSLYGNPCALSRAYRLRVVQALPGLDVLDDLEVDDAHVEVLSEAERKLTELEAIYREALAAANAAEAAAQALAAQEAAAAAAAAAAEGEGSEVDAAAAAAGAAAPGGEAGGAEEGPVNVSLVGGVQGHGSGIMLRICLDTLTGLPGAKLPEKAADPDADADAEAAAAAAAKGKGKGKGKAPAESSSTDDLAAASGSQAVKAYAAELGLEYGIRVTTMDGQLCLGTRRVGWSEGPLDMGFTANVELPLTTDVVEMMRYRGLRCTLCEWRSDTDAGTAVGESKETGAGGEGDGEGGGEEGGKEEGKEAASATKTEEKKEAKGDGGEEGDGKTGEGCDAAAAGAAGVVVVRREKLVLELAETTLDIAPLLQLDAATAYASPRMAVDVVGQPGGFAGGVALDAALTVTVSAAYEAAEVKGEEDKERITALVNRLHALPTEEEPACRLVARVYLDPYRGQGLPSPAAPPPVEAVGDEEDDKKKGKKKGKKK